MTKTFPRSESQDGDTLLNLKRRRMQGFTSIKMITYNTVVGGGLYKHIMEEYPGQSDKTNNYYLYLFNN